MPTGRRATTKRPRPFGRTPDRRLPARLLALLLPVWLAAAPAVARAAEPGPVGLHVDGDEAWVAFADRVLRIDLSWARAPRVFAAAPESAAKVKWVATCAGCAGVVFIVDFDRGTAIRWAARDGSSPPVELVAPDRAARWKSVALGERGARVWAADVRGDQIRELRIDPATGVRLGDRKLAEVEAPYAVTALGEAGLLVTTHDDRILWLDLEGGTRADWDVAGACPYESENRGPLRRALRDPASRDLLALNHRSLLRVSLDGAGERIARCTIVAGDPRHVGFVDACGEKARFGHPHDIALVADGSAVIVTDTDNDVVRRVSLPPRHGAGCVSTIPLVDAPAAASARRCAELGWPTHTARDGEPGLCSGPRGELECSEPLTWEDARLRCESIGARLCTHRELAADAARGSTCGADDPWVWSATRCEHTRPSGRRHWDAGAITQAGTSPGLAARPPTCRTSGRAHLRCCADAR